MTNPHFRPDYRCRSRSRCPILLLIGLLMLAIPAIGAWAQEGTPTPEATQPAAETDDSALPAPDPLTLGQLIRDPKLLLSRPDEAEGMADLSPLGMYRNADIVVKLVMLGLVLASLVTWTIWLAKLIEVFLARSRARRATRILTRCTSLDDAASWATRRRGAPATMLRAVMGEISASTAIPRQSGHAGLKERVSSVLDQRVATASRQAAAGTSVLATIGATAPFVGLFGTVWGIMNAFIGISEAQSSSLAVVAPGIAEALLATALGLVAAIPAVIIYNINARGISGYRHDLSTVAASIERLLSRDLDFGRIPAPADQTSPLTQQ